MNMNTKKVVTVGVFTALATVLMFIEIANPLVPFLKLDISDVAVLLVLAIYGWKPAATTIVLRGLIHGMYRSFGDGGFPFVGTAAAIIASLTVITVIYYAVNKYKWNKVVSSLVMMAILTVVMTVLNYFFITPLYFGWPTVTMAEVQGMFSGFVEFNTSETGLVAFDSTKGYLSAVLFAYVPFNLIKGGLIAALYFSISDRVVSAVK